MSKEVQAEHALALSRDAGPTAQRCVMLWFRTGSDSVVDNAFRVLDA
ncbi:MULTISPECIES: hypothetical protein [Kribbella]|nr:MULTISPECIES: hypothetical protein [Kribbella]